VKRFIVVLDIGEGYDGDKHDVADWLAMTLGRGIDSPVVDPTVYDNFTDISLDILDREGPFA
jgi:hypothetical protein